MVECKICGAPNALMKTFGIAPGDYCSLKCYGQERDRIIAEICEDSDKVASK